MDMLKTMIYGAGMTGRTVLQNLEKKKEDILFIDSDSNLWNTEVDGITVIGPDDIQKYSYDKIIIAAAMGKEDIYSFLTGKLHIPEEKIEKDNEAVETYFRSYDIRNRFLKNFAEIIYDQKISGSVAEGGVFEGRFSKMISKYFPDRRFYLFDTFEGFDLRDVECDKQNNFSVNIREGLYKVTKTVDEIIGALPHSENAIVRKGFFPETAQGIEDEFIFVNLDFDLYQPTIEGLRFFWPRMRKGGLILVHDYFNAPGIIEEDRYLGIRAAAQTFSSETGVTYIPIGDEMSIAFVK